MEYKLTLNLPKTNFPMKADLPRREPLLLEQWRNMDITGLISKKSAGHEKYVLHDGPPYTNGNIHIGHALNKTLKDIIVKYKTMRGFDSPYVPGWDCHGLPVEHQLFKELKISKYQIPRVEFRKKAYDYAKKYVDIQKEEFKRLGVFGDWEHPYLTLDKSYEEAIIRSFGELVKKGFVYRGLKPVNWCFKCETALAEAEVEYEDHTSPSVLVKFQLEAAGGFYEDSYFVIWTTTPWTLMANVAVAAHPDFIYAYIKTDKDKLIISKDLLPQVLASSGIEKYELIKEVKGKDLEGIVYKHPFLPRAGRLVLADYVSVEEGSGLVHTAPGHGAEDYLTGIKYKLEIIMPVDGRGNFDASCGELSGINVYEANKIILEKLESQGALLFNSTLQHSYPHCWRCKKPVIFRATKQWFLRIDHEGLRKRLIEVINSKVRWIPAAGQERIASMVELRPDWCLSRQRYWGVPIPALVCNSCKEEFLDPGVIEKFAKFTSTEGSDAWFIRENADFLNADLVCPYCGKNDFSKGADILDVWFDSGVSSQAVLKTRKELGFPADLYLEGSDQHRGWFQSSLIPAMCIDGAPPFKNVLTHGHVVDGLGRKMSKSMGNVIPPQDIIKDYGADIIRLWVASSGYNEDIRISKEILLRLAEAYRKIRNTVRFILSNLYDFNPDNDKVPLKDMAAVDKWILSEANKRLVQEATSAYEEFEFYKAFQNIYEFCNIELSSLYLDMAKGRLYTFAAASIERRAAQTAMYEILHMLVRVMAPILVFTAEETWQSAPKSKSDTAASVHLLDWPEHVKVEPVDLKIVMELVPIVTKALEEKRGAGLIGSSFDAKINILTKEVERYKFLGSLKDNLCEIFKVSGVELTLDESASADIVINVSNAQGQKCQRCWNYSSAVGVNKDHPLICDRCLKAIGG